METAAITVRWKIDDVKQKIEEGSTINSPFFDNNRWCLSMVFGVAQPDGGEGKNCSVFLRLLEVEDSTTPERVVHFTCNLETLDGRSIKSTAADRPDPVTYAKGRDSWGWTHYTSHESITSKLGKSAGIILEVSAYQVSSLCQRYVYPSDPIYASLESLFEDSTTDVVFKIRPHDIEESERHVYAHKRVLEAQSTYFAKLFGSGFSESTRIISYAELRAKKREKEHDEDDDDSTEWLPIQNNADDVALDHGRAVEPPNAGISAAGEAVPTRSSESAHTDDAGMTAETPIPDNTAIGSHSQLAVGKPSVEERLQERNLREVVVVDAGWTTFRALIYWMYTHELLVTELSSNYLVHLSSRNSEPTTSTDQEGSITATSPTPPGLLSRRAWLLDRAEKDARYSPKLHPIEPASPHAIYRLADKLDIPSAKELAKSAITKGFTIENILYELISTFSYHYSEMQEAALAFALEHWDQVKLTPAFKEVVAGSCMGRIEGASEIWMKLLGKLTVGSSTVPQKRGAADS